MVHSSRKRNFNKKKGHEPRENKWKDDRDAPGNQGYRETVKENEKYWTYYKEQNVFPLEQFDEFRAALQRDLPVSFRFQGCHKDREQLIHEMENRFFGKIMEAGDAAVCVPKSLPWYKEAYQTPMSRTAVRSHPILAQLHNFLVTEAELGNLSRQEAVSMIPPLLLAPTSEHYVLDLCAAPGSKTTQLLEMIHENDENPKGMVIANDVDMKRCYMLIHHTLKRFRTAACAITCEDAARFPKIMDKDGGVVQFDRVLADVICSGDGTLRKNPEIWKKWTPQDGLGLHRMQIAIARKGAQQLKVGGRMVYSTCSMNPIEDEAVVAQLLRDSKGSLKLVDTSTLLPELKRENGVNTWKVFDRDMKLFENLEAVTEDKLKKVIVRSCFPPTEEEAKEMNLHYTMRVTPHAQDTGGFYVALIEKVSETNFEPSAANGPAWKKKKMFKDEPFTFLKLDDERWNDIRSHYGVDESFAYQNLFSRRLETNDANSRQLFFANDAVKNFVKENMTKVSIQNAGMKMFSRTEGKVENTRFRLSQKGIRYLFKSMNKQKVKIGADDMLAMLKSEENLVPLESLVCKTDVRQQQNGTVVVYCDEDEPVCTWVGYHTIAPYISKEERLHLLRMMGVDCAEIELLMKSKRKEKAAQDREAAWARKEEESKANAQTTSEEPKEEKMEEQEGDVVAPN
uniref:tRNA (cytosine(34)-C(5))-methyltransferase n=1 Tax=Caenorhabditis japonica TaxID=281687 RepID=A0A8R1DSW3_CAEJA